MLHDDDLDDFSHLPSVDEVVSAEEKKALWKQHSRAPHTESEPAPHPEPLPEHTRLEEVMEEQLLSHHLPIEQELVAEHPSHTPEWAEDAYVASEPPREPESWVREAYEQPADDPPPPRMTSPVTAPIHQVEPQDEGQDIAAAGRQKEAAEDAIQSVKTVKVDLARLESVTKKSSGAAKPAESKKPEPKAATPKHSPPLPLTLPGADDEPSVEKLPPRADDPAPPKKKSRAKDKPEGADSGKDAAGSEEPKSDQPHAAGEVPHGLPHEPEPELTPRERFKKTWEKIGGRALAVSVAIHVALLIAAALIVVTIVGEKQVDFLSGGGSKGAAEAAQAMQHKVQQKRNTWLKNKQPLRRITSTSMAQSVTLPEAPPDLDFPDASKLIGGKGLSGGGGFGTGGMGKGFGSGLGFGGKISFMGNTGAGRNIIFVIDVSASMSMTGDSGTGQRISRFDLLKRELTKTLGRLPPNTQYQVLFFSDFAWPHNEVNSRDLKTFDKYRWTISPGKTNVRIPQFRYLAATGPNLSHSIELIKDADNPGGTNWGSGLCMALKGYPKPDVIFFMTDGNKIDAEGWVDEVSKFNLTGGKRTVINTTAMMEPDAALELDLLAKRNGGTFSIVTAKGFTLTSDEYFKGSK